MSSDVGTGGCTASSGSSVTPTPAATIWRSVSRLVARKPAALGGAGELAHRERLVAQAVALLEQQHVLVRRAPTGRPARRVGASGWSAGTASTKSSSNRSSSCSCVVVDRQGERPPTSSAPSRRRCEHDLGLLLDEQQLEVREAAVQLRHDVGQQVRARASGRARARTLPDSGSWAWRAMLADVLGLAEDDPGPLDHPLARVGEHDLARVALDELDAELALELLDLGRQRRLADEAGLGGPAEVAVLGDGDEVPEIAQVHGVEAARSAQATSRFRAAAPSDSSGADVRIRWSKALSAAVDAGAHGDDDLLVRHGGAVAGGEHAGHRGLAAVVDRRSRRAATARRVPSSHSVFGQQADLHEDAVEVDRVRLARWCGPS